MKLFNIFSVAACIFTALVAGTPVHASDGNSLIQRAENIETEVFIDVLAQANIAVEECNKKWETLCAVKCTKEDIKAWQAEVAVIINLASSQIKDRVDAGFRVVDPAGCVALVVQIMVKINVTLNILAGKCELLATLIVSTILALCVELRLALNSLLLTLAASIDNLLIQVTASLSSVLGTLLCLVCAISDIVLI